MQQQPIKQVLWSQALTTSRCPVVRDVCHSFVGDTKARLTTHSDNMSHLFGSSPTSNHSPGANATSDVTMTDVIERLEQPTFPYSPRTVHPNPMDEIIPDSEGEDMDMPGELLCNHLVFGMLEMPGSCTLGSISVELG
jgi:hypothetical protein